MYREGGGGGIEIKSENIIYIYGVTANTFSANTAWVFTRVLQRLKVNSNFDSKFINVGVIDSNSASGVVVHSLHESRNPFLYAKFLHGPPDDFSWYAIERLFNKFRNKCEIQFLVLSKMFFL